MITVGVRDLKNSLTRYLRFVERGESVLITNRSQPVAVLTKPDRHSPLVPGGRKAVARQRLRTFKPFTPVRIKGKPVSRLIIEDRR